MKGIHLGGLNNLFLEVPLAIGTLQWGTTILDEKVVNRNGCISEKLSHEIVELVTDSGKVSLFDTAEGYGGGTSELRLGRAVKNCSKRENVILMTKFLPTFWRLTRGSFERALRGSLKRLGVDSCGIYLLHTPVHFWPIEFWIEAAAECKKKGLIQAVGLSNCNADQVRRAYKAGQKFGVPIAVNQVMYNLLDYNSDKLREMEKACNDLGITIIAYSPIGQGLLTDGLTEEKFSKNRPAKMTGITWDSLKKLRDEIKKIAIKNNKTMAQVAINWTICHNTVPLVGCRSITQAKDSLGSLGWSLNREEVAILDKFALSRSTLESPTWRRSIFVTLAGIFMVMCKVCQFFGFGFVKQAQ